MNIDELLMGGRAKYANSAAPSVKTVNAKMRQVVSTRFVAAREMNGMSQTEASIRMGYKKSTQLCLWEMGKRLPPIDRMIVASLCYSVSLDYLYGLSDEPERDPRFAEQSAMLRTMEDMLRANAQSVAATLTAYARTGGIGILTVKALNARAADASAAVRRFVEINQPKFDSMRGGAPVLMSCTALESIVRETTAMIARQEGVKEQALRAAESKSHAVHPLFDTPEYRQAVIGEVN